MDGHIVLERTGGVLHVVTRNAYKEKTGIMCFCGCFMLILPSPSLYTAINLGQIMLTCAC